MLIYTDDNIFNSPAQTLVNTVNTYGVMGKGIAKEFKKYYPEMFYKYKTICKKKKLDVGLLLLSKGEIVKTSHGTEIREKWVLNFPTKRHWRSNSKLEYIEKGLKKFVSTYEEKGITSISFPQLGVGNGNLEWDEVKILMEKYLRPLPIPVYIHIYYGKDSFEYMDKKQVKRILGTKSMAWKTRKIEKILESNFKINETLNENGVFISESKEREEILNTIQENTKWRSFNIIGSDGKKINSLIVEGDKKVVQQSLF